MNRTHSTEAGFTLVEMIIVATIVAVLMAISIPAFFGAKNTAKATEIVDAAQSYALAIEAYKLDHGGKVPQLGGTDWADVKKGPINPTFANTPRERYLRGGIPSVVQDGVVAISTSAASGTTNVKHIQYRTYPTRPTDYSMVVTVLGGNSGSKSDDRVCFVGQVPVPAITGIKEC